MRDIARSLGVWHTAVAYELKTKTRKRRVYNAKYAKHLTKRRREHAKKIGGKIAGHQTLRKFVESELFDDQSPEAVSGRLQEVRRDLPYVSKSHIRAYIKSVYGRRIEAHRDHLLARRRRRRSNKQKLKGKRMIAKRPKHINERKGLGHAEGDFIVSGRSGVGLLLVLTDRNVRLRLLERILPVSARNVRNALVRIKRRFPELKTITFDNDILFVQHKELEKLLDIKIYFCDPHSPWQKGSVENLNKTIRPYVPKSSNISGYSRLFFQKLEAKLNRRFLKLLGYRSPGEMLARYRKRKKNRSRDSNR